MRKKEAKKRASGAQCVLEAILSAKSEATGSADYGQTFRNIEVFTLGGFRRLPKVTFWTPKNHPLGPFLARRSLTMSTLGPHFVFKAAPEQTRNGVGRSSDFDKGGVLKGPPR